jgi:hypothetical protein
MNPTESGLLFIEETDKGLFKEVKMRSTHQPKHIKLRCWSKWADSRVRMEELVGPSSVGHVNEFG